MQPSQAPSASVAAHAMEVNRNHAPASRRRVSSTHRCVRVGNVSSSLGDMAPWGTAILAASCLQVRDQLPEQLLPLVLGKLLRDLLEDATPFFQGCRPVVSIPLVWWVY
jgi:hypothetical protein